MQDLFGGSSGGQSSASSSGYSALPPALQSAFTTLGTGLASATTNASNAGGGAFTPTPISGAQQGAVNAVNTGFAPTTSSVNSDMAMQMNPYMSSVIGGVNQNANAANSVFNQSLANAGIGPDSNRSILGANDIQQTENNTIGTLLSNQFNTAMQNALTTLPGARAQDAANQLQVGSSLQNLQNQTNMAPITALLTGISGISPFTAGGTSSGSGSSQSQNGIFSSIGL